MAMKRKTPCLDCTERRIGCHSFCKEYVSFREKNLAIYERKSAVAEDAYTLNRGLRVNTLKKQRRMLSDRQDKR